MRTSLTTLTIMACLVVPATAETAPWQGNHWRADVEEIANGHRRHLTMIGTETGHGTKVEVTCADRDLATGVTRVHHAVAPAESRQGDWEGDAGPLGQFGSSDGKVLRWFVPSPCPGGRMVWRRLQGSP